MKFFNTNFDGLWLIESEFNIDNRGYLTRLFCKNEFDKINFHKEFVQENLTLTKTKGTFRGFHYQLSTHSEAKLVRCISGKVTDIVIDLRKNSKTFLKSFSVELDSSKLNMILIPEGFAHGFQTLTDNCMMLYLHSNFYNANFERGIRYNDPVINVQLLFPVTDISERDKNHPLIQNEFEGI
ncbi:MAG: dTDP-4-dehydrorhamnose 3,5-epimerase family protein [Ignavibacteriaceae bacterium]|nr:dTDP-4-dehydrorhamnose 3,5-epimerase family protein [Ignavibacteriaceae bacterium]HRN27603.1 dTDP-4-dehydrorhamnose 3,5-epimerase family protein [Ignavibacteriaceae bacterium]HRP92933.1 dTDP-4-dehydrorhamnose 3,5-epimerase family protein [Ignavibacteriaceae bacterium]HRQ55004.1 dTDP-4-dehydrorhamnose 3,5-epimerase family protein [Ignavibacteriaceae bacterium]